MEMKMEKEVVVSFMAPGTNFNSPMYELRDELAKLSKLPSFPSLSVDCTCKNKDVKITSMASFAGSGF